MSRLASIKQKILSIKTTKKITYAVRLASRSFYARLEKQQDILQHYKQSTSNLLMQLITEIPEWKHNILFPQDVLDSTPLIIVCSSTKGLCGSFNSNLFRYFTKVFFKEEHQTSKFITIGQRATKFVSENKFGEIIDSFPGLKVNNFVDITNKLHNKIIEAEIPFSSVVFYSNFLKNFFIQTPKKSSIIPLILDKESKKQEVDLIWEQDKEQILSHVATLYIKGKILDTLFQSLLSENAARFVAMDSATTNAESMLEKLTLQYNKARQTLITQEVAELSINL
ncbi:F0F1 ATP synthase subunit gamma [Candidatus Babeliales bacterium]|nr:F0F1 ATP synthase subunit gamma [Candidatus Babeliales bacterium]MCF7899349.1 F0F1 ATP synthase subunit gamma [Candidatus Babeliales bacterium]